MLRFGATRVLASMSHALFTAARHGCGHRMRAASLGNTPRALSSISKNQGRFRVPCATSVSASWLASPRAHEHRVRRRHVSATSESNSADSNTETASSIYDNPALYEMAFGFRDFDHEVLFLNSLSKKHGAGEMTSVLEIGAGPAWHSVACVTSLPHSVIAVAIDNSHSMLERAKQRAREFGCETKIEVVEGDMTALDVEGIKGKARELLAKSTIGTDDKTDTEFTGFDCATILLGTAAHLVETEHAIACFQSASKLLNPTGILILELEHPYDLFDGQLMDAQGDAWDREVEGDEHTKVLVEWGREGDYFDVETHVVERTVGVNVVDGKGLPKNGFTPIEETVTCKIFTCPEIHLLARLAGLKVVATYGDMDIDVPLTHEDAHNMIVVLKRDD